MAHSKSRRRRAWAARLGLVLAVPALFVVPALLAGTIGTGGARVGVLASPGLAAAATPATPAVVRPPIRTTNRTVAGLAAPVRVITDIPYAKTSPAQVLDLLLPAHPGRRIPLVIGIHGGAFIEGDKSETGPDVDALLVSGYAVARVNYRLSGEARFPAAIQDVKAAVRWLRAHATGYGLRADQFAAWGDSAGGYLAVMLGVTGDQRTVFDAPVLGYPTTSSAVQAVVDWYGPADFLTMDRQSVSPGGCPGDWWAVHDAADSPESLWLGAPIQSVPATVRTANPITYLAKARRLPRFLVAHGTADCTVPHGQSLQLVGALTKRRAAVRFYLVRGVGHSEPAFEAAMTTPSITWLHGLFDKH
jgi:acetyl esterase/lipase